MVSNGNAAGRRLSIYPHVHIVIAYTSQLVLNLKDGFKLLKEKYPENLPSMITNITGPSRRQILKKLLFWEHTVQKNFLCFYWKVKKQIPLSNIAG